MRYHQRIPPATAVASGSGYRPDEKHYRWNGDPAERYVPGEPERRSRKKTAPDVPTKRQERLAWLARMRLYPGSDPHPPPGYITIGQAARELGVTPRTILRYKGELRKAGAL